MARSEQKVIVEGHRVTLSNLEKILYPTTGTTTLTYLGQMASLELHVPQWRVRPGPKDPGTITSASRHPDRMVFDLDLDPGPGRDLSGPGSRSPSSCGSCSRE